MKTIARRPRYGKGDWFRKVDKKKFDENYERIFNDRGSNRRTNKEPQQEA